MDIFSQSTISSPERSRLMILVVSILIIGIISYLVYRKYKPTNMEIALTGPYPIKGLLTDQTQSSWKYLLTGEQSQKMTSNNITAGFFLYVDGVTNTANALVMPDNNYSHLKYVLQFGSSIMIKVDPIHQQLIFDILETNHNTNNNEPGITKTIEIKNIFNAKWNQILFTVEGRTVDIYVNGNLATSTLLDNIPLTEFFGIWLNESPDFEGQIALIQVWPQRRTAGAIMDNYQRKTDSRGKPFVPDPKLNIWELFKGICSLTGFCGFQLKHTPLEFIDYEFA